MKDPQSRKCAFPHASAGSDLDGAAADAGRQPTVPYRVWASLAEAADQTSNPRVSAAFRALEYQSERIFHELVGGPPDQAIRIVFTRVKSPYSSDNELIFATRATRVLEIASVAGDRDRPHPIMGNQLGGSYDKFRAVHDALGHVATGLGFDAHDEIIAWQVQEGWYQGLARHALGTELYGEICVRSLTRQPAPHRAVLLHPQLLDQARRELNTAAAPLAEFGPFRATRNNKEGIFANTATRREWPFSWASYFRAGQPRSN